MSSSSRLFTRLATTGRSLVILPRTRQTLQHQNHHHHPPILYNPVRTEVTTPSGGIVEEPKRVPFGVLYVALTIIAGLTVGATISKNMANFLEENEIFAPADDDDDD